MNLGTEEQRRGEEVIENEAVRGNSPSRKKRLALDCAETPCGFRVGLAQDLPLGRKGDDDDGARVQVEQGNGKGATYENYVQGAVNGG